MTDAPRHPDAQTGIDATVPHSARIWNYWLGGRDNYPVDRAAGDAWVAVHPEITVIARESRAFLARVVRYLAGEAGVRQFLDIGTGLPTADNTHEVAQRVAPDARIVYVDNDPLVLAHARALLTSTPQGATHYIDADMQDAAKVLDGAARILDFTQPVALMFIGVLGHVADYDDARALVWTLVDALPSGSYLVVGDGSEGETVEKAQEEYEQTGAVPYINRTAQQVAGFFEGLQWVDPGFVALPFWRPADASDLVSIGGDRPPDPVKAFGGVARKP